MMLIDTHCHLNLKPFVGIVNEIVESAFKKGVKEIVIPGTDISTSKKAVELASKFPNVYATVGIHPHHVYELRDKSYELGEIEKLLSRKKVVGVGEVGLDKYEYKKTKYSDYQVTDDFINLQKELLITQIKLAIKYKKALVLHNREATPELLDVLEKHWHPVLTYKTVFHCCEANELLLEFATKYHIYIGIDGDITWSKRKQRFIKQVPLKQLVLETDSPFLTPEPVRQTKEYPNVPANLIFIVKAIAAIKNTPLENVTRQTTTNAQKLFSLTYS